MGTSELPTTFPSGPKEESTQTNKAEKVTINTTDDIIDAISGEKLTRLKSFAMKLCGNDTDDAKDLYQETIARILDNIEKFKLGTNFKARTHTIMKNLFINEYRKKVKRQTTGLEYVADLPSGMFDAESSINAKQLNTYISELEDSLRIPFELHNQGFMYQEIADQFDLPLGTVKSRIFFARKKLKELITSDNPVLAEQYKKKKKRGKTNE